MKYHVSEILGKLGVDNRADAARWAEEPTRLRAWSGALAPLAFLQRVRLGWLSGVAGAGVAAAVVAGLSVLAWTLMQTSDDDVRPAAATSASTVLDTPGETYGEMDFISDAEGWMLASGGILHTSDGGTTWAEVAQIEGNGIDFVDDAHGWVVGTSGAISRTDDGGHTWTEQASGTEVHLSSVAAINENEAWVVGDGRGFSDQIVFPLPTILLHTTDGGETWEPVETPAPAWFNKVQFIGETGWVFGTRCDPFEPPSGDQDDTVCGSELRGAVLRTTDGGETWSFPDSPLPQFISSALFVNTQHGWLTGVCEFSKDPCPPGVYATGDGGETWQLIELRGYESVKGVSFRDTSRGWAVATEDSSDAKVILTTVDGGRTWDRLNTIEHYGGYVIGTHATENAVYITGQYTALKATAGANLEEMVTPAVSLGPVNFLDAENGYSVRQDSLLWTHDGGLSWEPVGEAPDPYFGRVDFIDSEHGFALSGAGGIAESGTLLRTEDGGRSWEEVSPSNPYGDQMEFTDRNHGWLLAREAVYVTQDGGESWQSSSPRPHGTEFLALDMIDRDTAWATVAVESSDRGPYRFLLTTDGGTTWRKVGDTDRNASVRSSLTAVDETSAWYATATYLNGTHNALSFTHDGGVTWSTIDMGQYRTEDIEFADELNGWISATVCEFQSGCTGGALLRTADGGHTWAEVPLNRQVWGDLHFIDEATGWLQPLEVAFGGNETSVDGRTLLYEIR